MPRICQLTGRGTTAGNSRSHSMQASKRTFKINLITKNITLPDGSKMKLKVNSRLYKKYRGFI